MAQTVLFQLIPSATGTITDKSLRTQPQANGGKYNTGGFIALDGSGGIYVQDQPAFSLEGGLQVEMVVSFPTVTGGQLLTKLNTMAVAVENSKMKMNWIRCQFDPYNSSTDQINGIDNLEGEVRDAVTGKVTKAAKKHVLRWSYDPETGKVTMTLDGKLQRERYRFFGKGPIASDFKSPWQFLVGMKCNVYSITAWAGKPTLTPAGMEVYSIGTRLLFSEVDPIMIGSDVEVSVENPNGAITGKVAIKLDSTADTWLQMSPWLALPGCHTLHLSATKASKVIWQNRKMMVNREAPAPRLGFMKIIYHVERTDFALAKSLGATHLYCDEVMNDNGGWKQVPQYLDAAQANGLKLFIAASYHAKAAPFAMAENLTGTKETVPHPALEGWYSQDEAAGTFDRLAANYMACRMASSATSVELDLNNFQRLKEAAQYCNRLWVNVYLKSTDDRRKITDVVKKAAALQPTVLVLPLYDNMKTSRADLLDMARIGKEAGCVGIAIFEMERDGVVWTADEQETVRQVFASL